MIEADEEALSAVLTGSFKLISRVDSYYDNQLVAQDIPVSSAYEEVDAFRNVQQRAEFRLPRYDQSGMDWSPAGNAHPLAANGQQLRTMLGVGMANNEPFWFRRSTLRIDESTTEDGEVVVQAVGLEERMQTPFAGPYQPSGTLASSVYDLVSGLFPVLIDDSLTDRAINTGIVYDGDRLDALFELLETWPAEATMTPTGQMLVRPVLEARTPLFSLVDGLGGTVIKSTGYSSSEGDWNCVVVRFEDGDTGIPGAGVEYLLDSTHPKRYGGPNSGSVPRPFVIDSDAVNTLAEANSMAAAKMKQLAKPTANSYDVEMIPNPFLEIGDVGTVTMRDGTTYLVEITQMRIPYLHDSGSQTMTVRVI